MRGTDLAILLWLNGLAGKNALFDRLVAAFTVYAPGVFLILFLAYFLVWRGEIRMRRTIVLAGIAGVLALTIAVAVSSVLYRARPFAAIPGEIRLLVPHTTDSSFPSDHATGSAAFAAGMWGAPGRSARWVFAGTALLVGISRLIAGVHWPSDVLASFVLGGAVAWATVRFSRPLWPWLDRLLAWVSGLESRFR